MWDVPFSVRACSSRLNQTAGDGYVLYLEETISNGNILSFLLILTQIEPEFNFLL